MNKKPRKRRFFTPEFKADAAKLVLEGGRTVAQVAKDLDLTETCLRAWVEQAKVDAGKGAPGALTSSERDELQRLRRENKRLEMEREILKNYLGRGATCGTRSSHAVPRSAGAEGAAGCFLVTSSP